ncbi:hypothetical protein CCMA1212_006423, partial [Trichoderma ghanense]
GELLHASCRAAFGVNRAVSDSLILHSVLVQLSSSIRWLGKAHIAILVFSSPLPIRNQSSPVRPNLASVLPLHPKNHWISRARGLELLRPCGSRLVKLHPRPIFSIFSIRQRNRRDATSNARIVAPRNREGCSDSSLISRVLLHICVNPIVSRSLFSFFFSSLA